MKPGVSILFVGVVLLLLLAGCGKANRASQSSGNDSDEVTRSRLKEFDQGKITLDEVTDAEKWGKEWPVNLLTYYASHKEEMTPKMKIAISRCFAGFGKFKESAALAQEYVNVYSNDCRGWDILAGAKIAEESFEEGFVAATNALNLGCLKNIVETSMVALKIGRDNYFESVLLPRLLALKDDRKAFAPKEERRLEVANALVVYSVTRYKKEVFLMAVTNLTYRDLTNYSTLNEELGENLEENIRLGCEAFETQETVPICKELSRLKGK